MEQPQQSCGGMEHFTLMECNLQLSVAAAGGSGRIQLSPGQRGEEETVSSIACNLCEQYLKISASLLLGVLYVSPLPG